MNADGLRAMFGAIDKRRWNDLPNYFHADVRYERPGYEPITGLSALLRFYAIERVIAEGQHTLNTIVIADHCGACRGTIRGTHQNGWAISEEFADIYEFSDGLIVFRKSYFFRPAV